MNWLRGAFAGAMLLLTGTNTPAQEAAPWVTVLDAQGRSVMGFAARMDPYRPGLLPRVSEGFTSDHDLRDRNGRVISGIAFYGWAEGVNVRVVLLVRVPAAGAENKFYSSGERSKLSLEEYASYRLGVGESRRLDELKSATFGPYSIRITAPQTPQLATPVTSATVRMIRKPVAVQYIHIENLREVPLLEAKLALNTSTMWHSFRTMVGTPNQPGVGPIAPGETRRLRSRRHGDVRPPTVRVTLAVFADGSHVGTPADVTLYRKQQDALAEDLTFWQRALASLPRSSPITAQVYLREKVQERLQADPNDPSQLRNAIGDWFGPRRAPDWVFTRADSALREIPERLVAATLHRKYLTADISGVEKAVAVRAEAGQGSDFVTVVENLRDTPLEAWNIDFSASPTARVGAGWGFDAGQTIEDGRPGGRLRRHETREQFHSEADNLPDTAMPHAVVSFALWNDLSWEGLSAMLQELQARRQRMATRYEFWIGALTEASAKPPQEALAFLRQQVETRRRAAPHELDFEEDNLRIWNSLLANDPSRLSDVLLGYRDHLNEQRASLTRHLNR